MPKITRFCRDFCFFDSESRCFSTPKMCRIKQKRRGNPPVIGGTMDKLEGGKKARLGLIERLRAAVELRKKDKAMAVYDLAVILCAFLLSRTHVVLGSHPLGIAFLSLLPSRVWIATGGAVLGSLTLGRSGIIYAMISVIVVFLRVIISGTSDKEGHAVFGESLILRMSASVIGGFVAAVYEVLLSGFSITTVAFGVAMILLPPVAVFAASGLFDGGPSVLTLFTSDARLLSLKRESKNERYGIIFYQCSALFALCVLSFVLAKYSLLGISLGYIFASFATLLVARRFGAVRAMAVGFATALPLSPALTAGFAVTGLVSGFLFGIGLPWALIGGGVALAAWSFYSGGAVGLLATLPEYMMAALVSLPLVKRLDPEKTEAEGVSAEREVSDMIGTVALSYKNKYTGSLDALALALSSLSAVVEGSIESTKNPTKSEIRALVSDVANRYLFEKVPHLSLEGRVTLPEQIIDDMTTILYKNGKIEPKMLQEYASLSDYADGICDTVNRAVSILREEKFRLCREGGYAEYLEIMSRMLTDARTADEKEKAVNDAMSLSVSEALSTCGLTMGDGKVFGSRRPHFIIAAEDETGKKISSPELKGEIERRTDIRLGTPEFYRRGNMALMECNAAKAYAATAAYLGMPAEGELVSGDSVRLFESSLGVFSAMICDGAGSGEGAERASRFVSDFLSQMTPTPSALSLVNHITRHRGEEYVTTADIFSLDLYTGQAYFLKSGASTSYVKRGNSIFRIKSRTAPLGVMKNAECEKIRVEIQDGDIVIMTSDGFSGGDDCPWIYELLAKNPPEKMSDYADILLKEAKKHTPQTDDMTVVVIKISKKR